MHHSTSNTTLRSTSTDPNRILGQQGGRSFGIVSSFPPTACGIATFSAALAAGLIANGHTVDVVRCEASLELEDPLVLASLGDRCPVGGPLADGANRSQANAIDVLNRTDVVILQHEYGLYDGADGAAVLDLMAQITVPVIVVAHTVVTNPTPGQRRVLEQLCDGAGTVVVMTLAARDRLLAGFETDGAKIIVVPHGAATPPSDLLDQTQLTDPASTRVTAGPPRLLTWGLIGPGKGIEWAIDAVAELANLQPRPHYIVAGATHPKVLATAGQAYRQMLVRRAHACGAGPWVSFDDRYRDLASLTELICSADLVVLPYDSRDQVTSGVLVDAVAAGRPVVSTAFPHAVELLGSGAGLVVPQRDPGALSAAIRRVLTDPELAASMAAEARRLAPDLSWPAVARQYSQLADAMLASLPSARS
jgi:polysaccharide biosynthesis protein PslF